MYIHESDRPIPEDVILNELRKVQDMVLCSNISDRSRHMLSSVIDAAFIMMKQVVPGHRGPDPYILRSGMTN